jgi:hypothetical protein
MLTQKGPSATGDPSSPASAGFPVRPQDHSMPAYGSGWVNLDAKQPRHGRSGAVMGVGRSGNRSTASALRLSLCWREVPAGQERSLRSCTFSGVGTQRMNGCQPAVFHDPKHLGGAGLALLGGSALRRGGEQSGRMPVRVFQHHEIHGGDEKGGSQEEGH